MTVLEQINYLGLKAIVKTPKDLVEWVRRYWSQATQPMPPTVRRALAAVFTEITAGAFVPLEARDMDTLKKLMYFCHPKAKTKSQAELFRMIHMWNREVVEANVRQEEACAVAKN